MSVREARVAAVFGDGIFAFGSFVVQAVGRHLEHKLEDCPGEPVEAEPQQAVPAAASLDEEAKRIVDEIMQDHHHLHAAGRTDGSADAACGSDDCERTFSSFGGHGKISGRRKNYTFREALDSAGNENQLAGWADDSDPALRLEYGRATLRH